MLCYLRVRKGTLHKIQDSNRGDAALKALASVIKQGWPESTLHLPPEIQDYFRFEDKLTLRNRIIFKEDRSFPTERRAKRKITLKPSRNANLSAMSKRSILLALCVQRD